MDGGSRERLPRLHFSKHLQRLGLEESLRAVKAAGFDGLDLTVRRGGSIEPEEAVRSLPEAVALAARLGSSIGMISTDIVSLESPCAVEIAKAASKAGVKFLKLGYTRYEGFGTLKALKVAARERLLPLAELFDRLGVRAGFHNHSADFLGASLWDVAEILDGIPSNAIGLYFDPAHATIEGGSSGWEMGLDQLSGKIAMLAVKDFRWRDDLSGYAGGRRHSVEFRPLESGNVKWREVASCLSRAGFSGPLSLHGEYQGPHSFADLSEREVLAQSARDLAFFNEAVGGLF